jgi:hypothetical protein
VTVIVSIYVAAATVEEILRRACPAGPVVSVIPAFDGELVKVNVLGVVPPVTVNVSTAAVPEGVAKVDVVAPPMLITGLTVTRKKYVTTLPAASVAVTVSRYVLADTLFATRTTTYPEFAVVVSRVIPALEVLPCVRVKDLFPVPPVTVTVSDVTYPKVVDNVPPLTVRDPARVGAGLTTTVKTDVVVAPTLSLAVIVS